MNVMSQQRLDELRLDLAELERIYKSATRQKIQELLAREMDKLCRDMQHLEKLTQGATKAMSSSRTSNSGVAAAGDNTQSYQENITNYAWDQSDKFLKLYLTLGNLSVINDTDILTDFSSRSVTVRVQFPNKTCQLHIAKLCEDIVPSDCYCKKKSEYVLVMMKKAEMGKTWLTVTEREKKAKEKDRPRVDESEDPSTSITHMLKNLYDEGDDEIKRSISKAWYQSQMKQGPPGAAPLPD